MKNIAILGAGGFIGTNLTFRLLEKEKINLTVIDKKEEYLKNIKTKLNIGQMKNIKFRANQLNINSEFDSLVRGQEVIYHLISSTNPSTSNKDISRELSDNVIMTNNLLEACVRNNVEKVVFLSSGGTVYGASKEIPFQEDSPTFPINSYGLQKITIEKLLYLYKHTSNLDYRVIRLANPYGPYQLPSGAQGVVTNFIYKALKNEPISIYGDGSIIRDYIYINDAITGIINITYSESGIKTYNLGSGNGVSINELINTISKVLNLSVNIRYTASRNVDAPINILDIKRYKREFKFEKMLTLEEGILKTADFLKEYYKI